MKLDGGASKSHTDRSSDNNISPSTGQATAVGFMASEFITRDMLTIIKSALTDVTAAHFEITNSTVSYFIGRLLGITPLIKVLLLLVLSHLL